ncbi:hypothetical protein MON38_11385 [Hymenobacter sp. DH14]|uniref:Uncharacterized protein n=1 Tax=Hymenobacter cyanobacteriorum TaxID=2926463 RepID=A0A9X1VG82_9BACT|nr:hypothetical protein [Hymenobacter cyanobacteriorum]MCI1188023.1 hypothetical protein [Hymenobacter cyanobacteriorum]
MQKIFLLLAALSFSAAAAHAQELAYPAKYQVYKIDRSSTHAGSSNEHSASDAQTWTVNLLVMVQATKKAGVYQARIYNTTGGEYFRKMTGLPAYTVTLFNTQPRTSRSDDGTASEIYSDTMYKGQLAPPKNEVDEFASLTPIVGWHSDMTGHKLLELVWENSSSTCSKDGKRHQQKCRHYIAFHCIPVQ